ncbi:hypothetical protein KIPB_010520, partial [Kipferlia bialata]|eukprot:g10520.t1
MQPPPLRRVPTHTEMTVNNRYQPSDAQLQACMRYYSQGGYSQILAADLNSLVSLLVIGTLMGYILLFTDIEGLIECDSVEACRSALYSYGTAGPVRYYFASGVAGLLCCYLPYRCARTVAHIHRNKVIQKAMHTVSVPERRVPLPPVLQAVRSRTFDDDRPDLLRDDDLHRLSLYDFLERVPPRLSANAGPPPAAALSAALPCTPRLYAPNDAIPACSRLSGRDAALYFNLCRITREADVLTALISNEKLKVKHMS